MDASLWVSKTGLDAQQTRMNVISNNLANVNTTGFKRDRAVFEDLLYQNFRQAGGQTTATTQAPTGMMLGTGVKVTATEKLHAQGNLINSQNPLDVAIMGDGFFQIAQQDGTTGIHTRWCIQIVSDRAIGDIHRFFVAARNCHSQQCLQRHRGA